MERLLKQLQRLVVVYQRSSVKDCRKLQKTTTKNHGLKLDTLKDVACGAALCGASEKLPTIKLKGLNAGRNSYSSVFKSGMTKLKNGTARRMSLKVFGKGLAVELFNGIGGTILDIHAEIIEGRKSCRLYSCL